MNLFRISVLRLRAVFARRALEAQMQEEMRGHLERATERLLARGMSPADARIEARREFGNLTVIEEDARDARGARWIDALVGDVRFAFRYFARKRLMSATIAAVLALGIGANSAIFTVLHGEMARPAPAVPKDDAHARIYGLEQTARGAHWQLRDFSFTELAELAARRETFADVAAWAAHDVRVESADSAGPRDVGAEFVTPNYFAVLGVAVAGPGFKAHDPATPGAAAVISFALAEELYASPLSAIGSLILVNDVPLRVVGVAPDRFQGAIPNSRRPRVWIPLSMRVAVARTTSRWLADSARLSLFARLAPGVSHEQATAIARNIGARMLPDSAARVGLARSAEVRGLRELPSISRMEDEDVGMLIAIGTIGLLILLVACTNVSALLVAAAVGRRHEIAVRLSLGASRARLLQQLLTESALLAVTGGLLGLLLYWWLTRALASRMNVDIMPDLTTVSFTLLFAVGTGVIFGLSPAMHATRNGVGAALRDSGTASTQRSRLQRAFVVAQIGLSQPLLVVLAVVLSVTVRPREPLSPTVANHVISARFRPPMRDDAARRRVLDSLIGRLAAHPLIERVMADAAGIDFRNVTPAEDSGAASGDVLRILLESVPPGYFGLLEVPILLGRDLSLADTVGTDHPVVIGSDVARLVWADANPLGRELSSIERREGKTDSISMIVVGVFDATHPAVLSHNNRKIFTAHGKTLATSALLLRTRTPAEQFLPELQKIIRAEAPALAVSRVETLAMKAERDNRESRQVTQASLAGAALAMLLASFGLYGVVSLAVGQRMREIGIRIAVGGRPARVACMFFASGMRLGIVGLVIGLPASLALLRLLVSQGVLIAPKANVWLIGAAIAAGMVVVTSTASWLPARRAAHVDPATTLRVE